MNTPWESRVADGLMLLALALSVVYFGMVFGILPSPTVSIHVRVEMKVEVEP